MRIASFPPFVNADAEILILGTMPGAMSLAKQEYYAHRQNAFWKIMYTIFSDGIVPEAFSQKVALLAAHNIALWDVLAHCERKGSLDSNIKNQVENDILGLLSEYPKIRKILFNGKESHRFFLKKFGPIAGVSLEVMPSTSPAYTLKFDEKLKAWRSALRP